MARIRSPGLTGNPLAAGLHSDPGCIGHHLAPATFLSRLSRGRQPPALDHCRWRRWAVSLSRLWLRGSSTTQAAAC